MLLLSVVLLASSAQAFVAPSGRKASSSALHMVNNLLNSVLIAL